jgi:hypothetical protein
VPTNGIRPRAAAGFLFKHLGALPALAHGREQRFEIGLLERIAG